MTDVTRKSGAKLMSHEGRAEDRRHSEVGCKTDVKWRPGRRLMSLGSQVQDQRHMEAGQKADITWRSGRIMASLRGWEEDRRYWKVSFINTKWLVVLFIGTASVAQTLLDCNRGSSDHGCVQVRFRAMEKEAE
ncbi:hypothetical protein IEQ34_010363 [Dendrobium chrysotoxum]|uniref:Uncharacterized protein n=1 Tax=Dendrobium chrysotoxum TaxID=161865 RepID=A0AAV7H5G8_DENCH|nr:hypothetical protein IEQ34_010363 [Dendrobium chrysotoxum]